MMSLKTPTRNQRMGGASISLFSSSSTSLPFVLLGLIFILPHLFQHTEAYKDGLYSTEDDVIPLNNATFMAKVLKNQDEKLVWVVEFYNSWCGHCINFAPTWRTLASSLKGWNDLVRIAAMDCSQAINLASCRKFEIEKYPTIKLFSPRADINVKRNQVMRNMNSREIEPMVRTIMDFMTEFALPSWPPLQPLAAVEDIWSEKTEKHKYIALIFEEATSQVGRKVILDMRHTPNILVRNMLSESVAKFGLTKFPSLYELSEDSTFRLLGVGSKKASEDHQLFVKMLQVLSRGDGDKLDFSLSKKKSSQAGIKKNAISKDKKNINISSLSSPKNNSLRVSMQDLESALHYGFRQEIAICKSIEGQKFNGLQKFIQVLLKYFPGRSPIMQFLQAVSQMLSSVTTRHLSGEEWITKIDNLQDSKSFLPDVIEWDCCKGSEPRYRGYPCAMWTLFHVLTVSAYTQQSVTGRAVNPLEVPLAIREYMDHFFGCAECSKHFLQMAATMEQDITDAKGAVLWLWSAHNKANKRLKGDQSEDRAFPKVQFPPSSLCQNCHSSEEKNSTQPIWNAESVLKFLISFYMEKNIYVSPTLSDSSSNNANVGNISTLYQAAKSKSGVGQVEELDWWEGKQREQDLKKVWWLRNRKKERDNSERIRNGDGAVERLGNPSVNRQDFAEYSRMSGGRGQGIFSDLDLSMCVVFYVISTVIILGLYHHFIVRRNVSPCPTAACLR